MARARPDRQLPGADLFELSFTVPFTVRMMVGYFSSIPRDLEESAMIDGYNHFGALCRIVLPPLLYPGANCCSRSRSRPRPVCARDRPGLNPNFNIVGPTLNGRMVEQLPSTASYISSSSCQMNW
jgi:hypothetical protein